MRLKQLEYLLAIRETGSILKVAKRLYVAQPSISVAIQKLEQELGATLIYRTHAGVTLTQKGELVAEHAEAIFESIRSIYAACDALVIPEGRICLGSNTQYGKSLITNIIIEMNRAFPQIDVRLKSADNLENLLSNIANYHIDGGLAQVEFFQSDTFQRTVQRYGLVSECLFTDELVFIVGRNHPLAGLREVSIHDILKYPYVTAHNQINNEKMDFLSSFGYQQKTIFINDATEILRYIHSSEQFPMTYMAGNNLKFQQRDMLDNTALLHVRDCNCSCDILWIQSRTRNGEAVIQASRTVVLDYCNKFRNPGAS